MAETRGRPEHGASDQPLRHAAIGQISVTVHNLPAAVSFYRDVLGLEFLFAAPPSMAFFSVRGIRLMLSIPEKPEFDHPASILYFLVGSIQDVHAALMQKGVIFDQALHKVARLHDREIWMAFFRDPDRNLLALMSEQEPA
ncbi:MAG: VOC family protein [Ignavibacteriales bacterium]|nr:VOC family protein [Ignavibacteriales bacterium]